MTSSGSGAKPLPLRSSASPAVREIWCCGCDKDVSARLTDGSEIYPHRRDLYSLPFWKCDDCGNFVGCHHKTHDRTRPLGCIPTPEIKKARGHIHRILDPIWKTKKMRRGALYAKLSDRLGWDYHTAELRSVEQGREVYAAILDIRRDLTHRSASEDRTEQSEAQHETD